MTLIIKTDFKAFNPVYNLMETVVFQDDAGTRTRPDYRYLFDIKIVDYISMSTVVIQAKVSPSPGLAFGLQNVGQFIESFIRENIPPHDDTSAFRVTDNALMAFSVEYGEEYRLTVGDPIVQFPNLTTGATFFAWGASLESHRWIDFYNNSEYQLYLFNTNNKGQFLTNNKLIRNRITDLGWHWFLTDVPTDVDYMEVKTFNASGVLIGTFQIPNNANTGIDQSHMMSLATAPRSLNNITGGFLLGAQPVIIASVATYTIQCFRSDATDVGETLNFTIEDECFYEVFRVHFENEYGAYDSFNFQLNSVRSANGEDKLYQTNANNLESTGVIYKHTEDKRVNYFVKSTDRIRLVSDFVTEAEINWLKELSFTPQIYLEFIDSSGVRNFKPATRLGASWRQRKTQVDKLFNFELEIQLNDNHRQRR